MRAWDVPLPPVVDGAPPALRVWDTATRELRPVAPGGTFTMYVCGITPYDAAHLGHAMTYLTYDLVYRHMLDAGHDVRYTQNVTDVDDPLFERAAETGEDWTALGTREIEQFRADMTALHVLPPTHFVGAVEAVPEIVDLVGALRSAGVTYDVEGDTYLSVGAYQRFGEIGQFDRDVMIELSRTNGGDPDRVDKKDPLDPLLWLAARPGEPSWEAPWGAGRPGWHVECSAIARTTLGDTIDLHGGGTDLVFPHHEMSATTSCLASGTWPFARTWLHVAMVGLHGEKMSKSKGNLVFVRHLRLEHEPVAVRLALLAHHYREPWEWFHDDVLGADERVVRWRRATELAAGPPLGDLVDDVRRRIADDLDAPGALAAVDRWVGEALRVGGRDAAAPAEVRRVVDALLGVRLS
ncbi:MAG TPA: cysteine--1-D-myo-inosityl 2-amino-2-deoxy-alpha-D-glucopyranoside ligase [Mycobacteriales bacterium]|nr:cysteine--1-D-myo-inosityl 2-amino-2-deoxy-alpha-D-glucopyranoside ligase [Mycobacteriales bacterium]